jgi:hypothetical protein
MRNHHFLLVRVFYRIEFNINNLVFLVFNFSSLSLATRFIFIINIFLCTMRAATNPAVAYPRLPAWQAMAGAGGRPFKKPLILSKIS